MTDLMPPPREEIGSNMLVRPAPPKHLFKYRSMNSDSVGFTKSIVVDGELYFASPSTFNDPFDTYPIVSADCTQVQKEVYFRQLVNEHMADSSPEEKEAQYQWHLSLTDAERLRIAKESAYKASTNSAICSLSARNDSMLMWAHYANNHKGICLRFSTDSPFFRSVSPVIYSHERPTLNRIKIATMPVPDMTEWMRGLITKADFWSYEEEWRVFGIGAGARKFDPKLLNGIILGARIEAESVQLLTEWIKARDGYVELFRAVPSEEMFSLDIVQLV